MSTRRTGIRVGVGLLLAVTVAICPTSVPADVRTDATDAAVLQEHIRQAPVFVERSAAVAAPAVAGKHIASPTTLARGQLYLAELAPQDEAAARAQVIAQLATVDPEAAASVRTFAGVVRVLANDGAEVDLKPYVRIGRPLRFVPDAQQFAGSLAIGVGALGPTQPAQTLSAPLSFKVLETGQQLSVQQLSSPYALIDVATGAATRPPLIHIAANFTDERLAATDAFAPALRVEIDHPTLESLGLQTATVTVDTVGGPTVPTGVVSLSASGAVLDKSRPEFDSHGRVHARLRGILPGRVTLSAAATGYDSGTTSLRLTWPWHAIISTLLGSLLGAAIRLSTRQRMTAIRLLGAIVWAVLVGGVMFGLYALLGLLSLLTPLHIDTGVADLVAFGMAVVAGWSAIGAPPSEELSEIRSSGKVRAAGSDAFLIGRRPPGRTPSQQSCSHSEPSSASDALNT